MYGSSYLHGYVDGEYKCEGPDRKNDAKILSATIRREHPGEYVITVEEVQKPPFWWDSGPYILVKCAPTPQKLAQLEAERKKWEARHPEWTDDTFEYRRKQRPRHRFRRHNGGRGSRPALEQEEQLEEKLLQPRHRKQRGWGDVYRPTRKRRNARTDLKNWKRKRRAQYAPL